MKTPFIFVQRGILAVFVVLSVMAVSGLSDDAQPKPDYWLPPGDDQLPAGEAGRQIRYGRELITHTAEYLGAGVPSDLRVYAINHTFSR